MLLWGLKGRFNPKAMIRGVSLPKGTFYLPDRLKNRRFCSCPFIGRKYDSDFDAIRTFYPKTDDDRVAATGRLRGQSRFDTSRGKEAENWLVHAGFTRVKLI